MTLSIRISTPQGLVFCSDSLVTTEVTIEELDMKKSGEFLPPGAFGEGSPPILTNPHKKDRTIIKNTTANVSKILQITNQPLFISVAGSGNFLASRVQNGKTEELIVPFESFGPVINQVTSNVMQNHPDLSLADISRCACYVLSCGINGANDVQTKGWSLEILGGGYSNDSPWPQVFDLDLYHHGQDNEHRISILDAAVGGFCQAMAPSVPLHCDSVNLLQKFSEEELGKCITVGVTNACIWTSYYRFSEEMARGTVIPECIQHFKLAFLLFGRIIDRWGLEGLQAYTFSDVITEMWELREAGYDDSEISCNYGKIFDNYLEKYEDLFSLMLSKFEDYKATEEICVKISDDAFSGWALNQTVSKEEWGEYPKWEKAVYGRLDEKAQGFLDYASFVGLYRLLGRGSVEGYIQSVVNGDLMFCEDWGGLTRKSFSRPNFPFFGIMHNGQTDVVERIMNGIDRRTRRSTERGIRDYTMSAASRLAEIIEASLEGRDPPSKEMHGDSDSSPNEFEEPPSFSSSTPDDGGRESEDVGDTIEFSFQPHIGFQPGTWQGFYMSANPSDNDSSIRNTVGIDFSDFDESGNLMGSGTSPEGEITATVNTEDSGDISISIVMRDEDSYNRKKMKVDGNLEPWGFSGGFDDEGEWRSFVMWPVDNLHSEIDSVSVIRSSLRTLNTELDEYPINPEKWVINWNSLPLKTAEEMANYLMESTVKKQHFNSEIPTVGGGIKTVTISPGGEIHEYISNS